MANVTYFFTIREIDLKRTSVESQINQIAQNIATMQLLDRQEWSIYQDYISQLMAVNKDIIYIAIYDDRNLLRAHTLNTDLVELDYPVTNKRTEANIVKQLDGGLVDEASLGDLRSARVNIMIGDRIIGSVNVGFSIIDINQELKYGILLNIGLSSLFVLIFSFVAYLISRRLTRPLERLSKAMYAVNEGDLSQKIEPETNDEISQLTIAFNSLVENLRERQIIDSLGHELSSTFQLENLAAIVNERLKNAIGASAARLYIEDKYDPDCFFEITVHEEKKKSFPPIKLNESTDQFLKKHTQGFMVLSAPDFVIKTLNHSKKDSDGFVIPMIIKDNVFGLLFFALPENVDKYEEKQKEFAATLSLQAALALENAFLYDKLREQERIKRELEIAREVQQKLLPNEMPQIPGFEIDGICRSAREVGGDYFDFFKLNKHQLGIAVADVSGKGTSASFYMAQIKGMMLQLTTSFDSPKTLLRELNHKLFGTIDRHAFVTMIYGILDVKRKNLIISRAGHNSLIKVEANQNHMIYTPSGIGLGLDSGIIFNRELDEVRIDLKKNDTLVFYTDGITEAMTTNGEEFGEERLLQAILKSKKKDVAGIRENIFESLEHFLNGSKPHDDITMVIINCNF